MHQISCLAAIELDNFILKRKTNFESTKKLVSILKEEIIDSSSANPSLLIALNYTFSNAFKIREFNFINELVHHTKLLIKCLEWFLEKPEACFMDISNLRDFCTEFSKMARYYDLIIY